MSPERLDPGSFGVAPLLAAATFSNYVWALGVVLLECHVGRYPLVAAMDKPDWGGAVGGCVLQRRARDISGGLAATLEFRSFVRRCVEKDWQRMTTR